MPLLLKDECTRIHSLFERQSMLVLTVHVTGVIVTLLGLVYYWFAVADRYHIFLYNHLEATPFDSFTISRYLMTGFVASGVIVVFHTAICWCVGSLARILHQSYAPPSGLAIWLLCLPFLALGIPAITMTVNNPTLPASIASGCAVTAVIGLALALSPGNLAAQHPNRLLCTGLAGGGFVPMLLFFRAIELPSRDLLANSSALMFAGGSILVAIGWRVGCILCSWRFKTTLPSPLATICAAFIITYLFLPLLHYLFLTPPAFHYITSGSNFFALTLPVQVMCWLTLASILLFTQEFVYRSS